MSEKLTSDDDESKGVNTAVNRRRYLKLASMAGTGLGTGLGASTLGEEFTTPVEAAPTTIEDFNRSSPLNAYDGETGGSDYSIVTDTLEPSGNSTKTLKATGSWGDLGHNNVSTPRGYEYRVRIEVGDSSVGPSLLTCVQNTSTAIDDCYWALVDQKGGELDLILRQNGSGTKLASASMSSLTQGAIYELAVELDSGSVRAILYESDGTTVVADTGSASDSTWSGGQLGFYTGGGSYPAYYDYVTKESLGDGSGGSTTAYKQSHIDDFEVADQKLDAYKFDRGKSGATIAANTESSGSQETYSGKQSLKISNSSATEMISLPGEGLEDYPEAGDTLMCYVKATGGADNFNFSWGVQGHSDRYYVKVKPNSGEMYLFKYKNNDGTVLDSVSGLSISQDEWYWICVHWQSDGTQTVELYDLNDKELGKCTGNDSEWTSGGVGFDAYLNSGEAVYFDDVAIIEEEGPYKGGWGPVHQPSPSEIPTSAPTGDGQWWDVDDLHFYLTYAGVDDGDGEVTHNFQVAGNLHTYKRKESFKDNQQSDELYPLTSQQSTKIRAEVTNNTQGTSVTSGDDANTWAYALDESEWERWKSSGSFDEDYGFNEFKAAAIQNGPLSDSTSDYTAKALSFAFSTGIGLTGPAGEIADLAINTIGFLNDLARDPEPNCDIDVDDDTPDVEFTEWNWCNEVALTMCTRSLEVDVEKGTGPATLVVEHEVLPDSKINAENVCKWEITCPDTMENATWEVSLNSGSI